MRVNEDYNTPGWVTVGFVVILISYEFYTYTSKFLLTWIKFVKITIN